MIESTSRIIDGVIIGGAGGAIAGLTILIVQGTRYLILLNRDKKRIYNWLKENTTEEAGHDFRSTRTIASHNNLTQDRVRFICSIHKNIHLSTGQKEDIWSIIRRKEKSVYEERGITNV